MLVLYSWSAITRLPHFSMCRRNSPTASSSGLLCAARNILKVLRNSRSYTSDVKNRLDSARQILSAEVKVRKVGGSQA